MKRERSAAIASFPFGTVRVSGCFLMRMIEFDLRAFVAGADRRTYARLSRFGMHEESGKAVCAAGWTSRAARCGDAAFFCFIRRKAEEAACDAVRQDRPTYGMGVWHSRLPGRRISASDRSRRARQGCDSNEIVDLSEQVS